MDIFDFIAQPSEKCDSQRRLSDVSTQPPSFSSTRSDDSQASESEDSERRPSLASSLDSLPPSFSSTESDDYLKEELVQECKLGGLDGKGSVTAKIKRGHANVIDWSLCKYDEPLVDTCML
jgi:hypothetical protein